MNSFQDRFNSYEGLDQAGQPPPDSCSTSKAPEKLSAHDSGGNTDARELHEELILELGDFLHRIPAHLLKPGHHDVRQEIRFSLTDIANWIAQRLTTIPIRLIHEQVPLIFDDSIREVDGLEIRFPWQKVLHLINETASAAPADSLAVKLKTRCTIENLPGARTTLPPSATTSSASPAGGAPGRTGETWLSRARQNARHPAAGAPSGASPTGMGRSPREYERTITELNRRIIALESTQKERAQELTKERELRLKAERQLAATERALQESATFAENTRAEARRELDVELRRRDAEVARIAKEHQKQIDMMKEELGRVKEERDELREKLKGSGDSSSLPDGWESPTVIRLNAEISECRERIQGLMEEREELLLEKEELLRKLGAAHQAQA